MPWSLRRGKQMVGSGDLCGVYLPQCLWMFCPVLCMPCFFMFSSYFADFCVPLFVEFFECAFQCTRDSGVLFGKLIYDSEPCRSG